MHGRGYSKGTLKRGGGGGGLISKMTKAMEVWISQCCSYCISRRSVTLNSMLDLSLFVG